MNSADKPDHIEKGRSCEPITKHGQRGHARNDEHTIDEWQTYGFADPLSFFKLVFDYAGRANLAGRSFKCPLLIKSRFHPVLDFFAQMAFQFVERRGSFDAGGKHLPPPFRDGLLEISHIAVDWRRLSIRWVPGEFVPHRYARYAAIHSQFFQYQRRHATALLQQAQKNMFGANLSATQ